MGIKPSAEPRKAQSIDPSTQVTEALRIASLSCDRLEQLQREEFERARQLEQCEELAAHKKKLEGDGFYGHKDPQKKAFNDDQLSREIAKVQRLLEENCPRFAIGFHSN